jgi:hypothetical protein
MYIKYELRKKRGEDQLSGKRRLSVIRSEDLRGGGLRGRDVGWNQVETEKGRKGQRLSESPGRQRRFSQVCWVQ